MRHRVAASVAPLFVAVLLAACGPSSAPSGGSAGQTPSAEPGGGVVTGDPCSLASPQMVAAAFGGNASEGVAGPARNCTYTLTGGSLETVNVYHYGSADDWDGVRDGFETNRGGTVDLAGIGEAAFYPKDAGPTEVVARAGGTIFSVSAGFGGSDEVNADVAELATAIAASLGD
jgi:hypothetical protein